MDIKINIKNKFSRQSIILFTLLFLFILPNITFSSEPKNKAIDAIRIEDIKVLKGILHKKNYSLKTKKGRSLYYNAVQQNLKSGNSKILKWFEKNNRVKRNFFKTSIGGNYSYLPDGTLCVAGRTKKKGLLMRKDFDTHKAGNVGIVALKVKEKNVWQAVDEIPYGENLGDGSYALALLPGAKKHIIVALEYRVRGDKVLYRLHARTTDLKFKKHKIEIYKFSREASKVDEGNLSFYDVRKINEKKILVYMGFKGQKSLFIYDIENSSWSENEVVDLNGKSKFKHLPILNSSGLMTFFSKDEKWLQAYIFRSGKWRKQDIFVNIPAKDCRVSDIESNAKLPLIIFKHLDGRQYLIKSVKKYSKPSWLNKIWNNTTKKIDGLFSSEEDKKWYRYFFGYNGEVYRSRKVKVEKLDKGKQVWNRTYSDFCIISSCYIDEMLKGPDFLALSERVWTIGAGAPSYRYYIFNSTSQKWNIWRNNSILRYELSFR